MEKFVRDNPDYSVPAKGFMGVRFIRFMEDFWEPERVAKYKESKQAAKAAMRTQWLKEQWGNYQEKRRKVTRRATADIIDGELLNLDQLVVRQGGWDRPSAVRGGLNIAASCAMKGPPWVEYNADSRRMEFRMRSKRSRITEETVHEHEENETKIQKKASPRRPGAASSPSGAASSRAAVALSQQASEGVDLETEPDGKEAKIASEEDAADSRKRKAGAAAPKSGGAAPKAGGGPAPKAGGVTAAGAKAKAKSKAKAKGKAKSQAKAGNKGGQQSMKALKAEADDYIKKYNAAVTSARLATTQITVGKARVMQGVGGVGWAGPNPNRTTRSTPTHPAFRVPCPP